MEAGTQSVVSRMVTDDPDIALLRVGIEKAEYWDSPGGTVAQVISFVSALAKGESAGWGENKKLDLT